MSTGIGITTYLTHGQRLTRCAEIVASVIGVAGAGFRLSLILNAISCEVANAPYEIKAISKSVTLYSHLLKQTASVLDRANSVHSDDAIRTTEEVLKESNAVFNEISATLDGVRSVKQDGSVSPSIPQRFKFCFKKHRIEYLLGRMDRLQMSLSLMLQIIQLGTTMAATSRHDSPVRVEKMTNKIQRERVEAQTVVIQYFQTSKVLDWLYVAAKEEETEPVSPIESRKSDFESDALTLVSSHDSQLTKVEQVPSHDEKSLTVSHHGDIFINLGDNWNKLGNSKADMIKCSEAVTNQLLEKWTVWREIRDRELQRPASRQSSRYNPVVQDLFDDEDMPLHERYRERGDSPSGKYIEGPTTDWRQPHSIEARQEARRRRKAYQNYQPSVEGSSEVEDSPGSNSSRKPPAKKFVIDSDPETSESEDEKVGEKPPTTTRRRSSAVPQPIEQKSKYADEQPLSKSYNDVPVVGPPQRPVLNTGPPRPTLLPAWSPHHPSQPPPMQQQQQQRPYISPDQNKSHHSFSSPGPSMYVHNGGPYPYPGPPPGQASPNQYAPSNVPSYPFYQNQAPRYMPRLSPQNSRQGQGQSHSRPSSRDGTQPAKPREGKPPKSPSRLSREYSAADYKAYGEEKKRQRKEMRKNIGDGATKGLLAGGGLAVFLEALECLDL